MKTQLAITCLLLGDFAAQAQFNFADPSFVSQNPATAGNSFNPTNIPGYPALAWYVAADYTTNAGVPTWPDRFGTANLTNLAANTKWPHSTNANTLNGNPALVFGMNGAYLASDTYGGSSIANYDIFILYCTLEKPNPDGTEGVIFDGGPADNGNHRVVVKDFPTNGTYTARSIELAAGQEIHGYPMLTNWAVYSFSCVRGGSPTASYVYTNGVLCVQGYVNFNYPPGITVGANYVFGSATFTTKLYGEILAYRTNLSAAARQDVANYLLTR